MDKRLIPLMSGSPRSSMLLLTGSNADGAGALVLLQRKAL